MSVKEKYTIKIGGTQAFDFLWNKEKQVVRRMRWQAFPIMNDRVGLFVYHWFLSGWHSSDWWPRRIPCDRTSSPPPSCLSMSWQWFLRPQHFWNILSYYLWYALFFGSTISPILQFYIYTGVASLTPRYSNTVNDWRV